jgi:hypothetical protein
MFQPEGVALGKCLTWNERHPIYAAVRESDRHEVVLKTASGPPGSQGSEPLRRECEALRAVQGPGIKIRRRSRSTAEVGLGGARPRLDLGRRRRCSRRYARRRLRAGDRQAAPPRSRGARGAAWATRSMPTCFVSSAHSSAGRSSRVCTTSAASTDCFANGHSGRATATARLRGQRGPRRCAGPAASAAGLRAASRRSGARARSQRLPPPPHRGAALGARSRLHRDLLGVIVRICRRGVRRRPAIMSPILSENRLEKA